MPRLPASLGSLLLLCVAVAAPAARYVRPGVDPDVAGAYRADRVTVRLRAPAAAAARAAVARAPRPGARPQRAVLGLPALDATAAAVGVLAFEPEFPAEPPPAPGDSRTDFGAFWYAELAPGADVDAALAALRANPDVASATPIGLVRVTLSPNDSLYAQQWSMRAAPGIDAERAWALSAGDSTIPIAIVDTGVLSWHPDIAGTTGGPGQLWTNAAEANGLPGEDDDHNGYVDDVHGWDFVDLLGSSGVINGEDWRDEDADPNDFAGHGTLVAGFAAAITDNAIGVAGTAWGSRIVPLRIGWSAVGGQGGVVDMSFAARAIRYATRTGIRIVNCSFQTIGDPALLAAVDEATHAGVLVVNAAGNFGEPCDFPGSDCHELADREDVLGVGALAPTGAISSVSQVGDYVDVYAPGEDLPSTITYHFAGDSLSSRVASYATGASGTSLAAPIASGVAALVLAERARHGTAPLRPMELLFRLAESDTGATGPRRLDAYLALRDTTVSFAVRGGARVVGAPVAFVTTSGSRIVVAATTDSALVWYSPRGDTLHRVALGAGVVGSPAAAGPEAGWEPRVFVALDDGRVNGFDGHGEGLPNWHQGIDAADGVPGEGPSLADVDGDGFADVVVVTDAGAVYAWSPFGQRLAAFPQYTDGAPMGTAALANIDGRPGAEVIVMSQGGRVFAFRDSAAAPVVTGWPRTLGVGARAPVVARFGATPAPRVVAAYGTSLRAYTPAGTVLWTRALGGDAAADPALGDVDGDGIDDIVVPLANPDAVAAFDTTGSPLAGWPVALTALATGPAVIRATSGRAVVFAPAGGKLFAFAGDGTRVDGWPKAGPAGNATSWVARVGAVDERLLAGGADSLLYFYTPPRGLAAADAVRSWASPRGTLARAASRFDVPDAGVYDDVPSVVTSVTVEATGATFVTLGWSATGDDGYRGRPKEYAISYTGGLGDPPPIIQLVVPATVDAGGHERATITGLAPSTQYQFSVIARDAAGLESTPSNFVLASTSAPAAAVSLRALAQPTRLPVTFEWRANGVPGQRIEVYDVTGRLRRRIELGSGTSGSLTWDGVDGTGRVLESGLYFARLRGGGLHDPTGRIVLVK